MSSRLLMLGLDSIDWMLINEWAAEGRLPVLRGLLADSHALLFGESNRPLPGSVWTDIATGVSAATHGFVHEEQLAPNSYRCEAVDSSRVTGTPFYKLLSDAGVRCAVVDFPVDHPLPGFNGLQVVDWGTEFKLWRFETTPASFAGQLASTYGRHPLTNYPGTRTGLGELLALKRKLHQGIDIKQRFATDLLKRREHDFIFFNFAELHKAGHFFWRFHDRAHPEFTTAEPQLVDSLREMYEHLDKAVGAVLAEVGDGDELVVITDRGMYGEHRGDHLVDEALLKLDLASPRGPIVDRGARGARRSWPARLLGGATARRVYRYVGNRVLPEPVREALSPLHRAAIGALPPFDWKKTRVFRLPSVGNSYLRVNLAGREPSGIVSPGADYDALLAEVAAKFRALVNPQTEEPAVEGVYFPAKQFAGPRASELPDIAVLWNSSAPIDAVTSDDAGMIVGQQASDRSGNHRPEGFALFRGPSLAADSRSREGDARMVAPLIVQFFGIPAPPHYEMPSGRGMPDVCRANAHSLIA
jgi:predicted AlkP superfamily phosphohydrolase/phosphomutase